MKKFLVSLLTVLIFSLTAVAQAEKGDPYFSFKIKNLDDYRKQEYNSFNKIIGSYDHMHQNIADWITKGRYFEAAKNCIKIEEAQKVAFGANYFDENLVEIIAKLYLEADELDEAEREINFLFDNAPDPLTKIRALVLKADLYNRRGKYLEALQVTEEVSLLLKETPNGIFLLINMVRKSQAYCGLGEIQKSWDIAKKILHITKVTFGENSVVNLSLLSTVIELCRQTQDYATLKEVFKIKHKLILDRYEQTQENFPAVVESKLDLAEFLFELKDFEQGEAMLNQTLSLTDDCAFKLGDMVSARKLYKRINTIASKYLKPNHVLILQSELGILYVDSSYFGDILQTTKFYEKLLPNSKKVFGEDDDTTLRVMSLLRKDYLSLGKYEDAKRIAKESLSICRKHFGDQNECTAISTIDLAEVYYKMGRYKTVDNLLYNVLVNNSDFFNRKPSPEYLY